MNRVRRTSNSKSRISNQSSLLSRASCLSLFIICSLLCGPAGAAQKAEGRFDLSGTWALDRAKSDFGPLADSPVVRAEVTLTVAHAGPELRVSRRETRDGRERTTELVYYTDGRGETNPSTLGRVGVGSKTRWDGDRIVSTSELTRRGADGKPSTLETVERWQLSADGRVLTQTTSISYGGGVQRIKQVYRRTN
jgi:hypothetical protein